MTEQSQWELLQSQLHPNIKRMMQAIKAGDWETVEQFTKGQKPVWPQAECARCQDRGWYAETYEVNDSMQYRTVTCVCPKGQQVDYQRWQGRVSRAEIPAQYQRYTFTTWQTDLTDSDQRGKETAYIAALRFCQDVHHLVNLREIYDIRGMEWEDWRDTRPKNSLVFFGDLGTGKTGLAISIVNELVNRGEVALYIRCRDMVRDIQSRYGKYETPSADDVLRKFQRVPVLLIDEFNIENMTADRLELIEDIMRYRYGNLLPTLMTCNIDQQTFKDQWGGRTGDVVIAMAHWISVEGAKLRRTDEAVSDGDQWWQK